MLVECAARLPGDEIVTLISLAYGFPMVEAYLRTLLGETPSLPVQAREAAAIRFLLSPPGRVTAVQGVEAADRMHGVELVHVSAAIGKMVSQLRSSWDRAGYVLSRAEQADLALSIAEKGAGMISFSTLPG